MYTVRVTATAICAIQDPIPLEGAYSVIVEAGETKEFTMLPAQYDRIVSSLETLQTAGIITYSVDYASSEETARDMTLYVDSTTGSDVTGNGTATAPFQTITEAYSRIPRTLRHTVKIIMATGTYAAFPDDITHDCIAAGQLVFEGSIVNAVATEYTVDSFDFGGADGYVYGVINVPTATWTINAHANKFVQFADGRMYGIISNTATSIRICAFFYDIVAAEKFHIVEPGVVVNMTHDIGIRVETKDNGGVLLGTYGVLGFYGIKLDDAGTWKALNVINTSAVLHGSIFPYMVTSGTQFNYLGMLDPVKAFTDATARDTYSSFFSANSMRIGGTVVCNAIVSGEILCWSALCELYGIAARGFWSRNSDVAAMYAHLDDNPSFGLYPITVHGRSHQYNQIHIEGSDYVSALRIKDCACVDIADFTCNALRITGPGATIGQECRISAHNITLSGTGGALKFDNSAAAVAWPAAGVRVADTIGSSSVTGY